MEKVYIGKFVGYAPNGYYQYKTYSVYIRKINNEILYFADEYCLELGSWELNNIKYNARLVCAESSYFVVPQFNNTKSN